MFFTPTNSEVYYGISKGYHEMFHDAFKEMKAMSGDKASYDILSLTSEEIKRYLNFEQIQRHAMMISIVFQAFAIEAYVNFIAVNLYEENEFFGGFEKKATMGKINKIFSEKLRSDFTKNTEIYDLVHTTFDLRDKLAHFKSKRIDLRTIQDNPEIYNPYELSIEHYEKIDEVIMAYPKFKKLVDGLLGYDIYDKQMNNIQELISSNIQEIYRKSLL
jgi:hypothetical protein